MDEHLAPNKKPEPLMPEQPNDAVDSGTPGDIRYRSLIQAGLLLAWVTAVAAMGNFVFFPLLHSAWMLTLAQVLLYGAMVLPLVVWARSSFHDFASPRWQKLVTVLLVGGSLIVASTVEHQGIVLIGIAIRVAATAAGEEVVFRGFIWDRTRRARWGVPLVIAVNVLAFALWHIPSMLAGFSPTTLEQFAILILVGLTLCIIRLTTRSLILSAAVHFAIDIL
jgi:membrane protease YdiL (CAAX protease family)